MYDYIEEFCPVDGYRCLMPIEYTKVNDDNYVKKECVCHNVIDGNCNKSKECAHFKAAPDVMDKQDLIEKKLQ